MKRIGIDARLYFQTGVGVYIRNILHYLQDMDTDGLDFYVYVMKEDAEKIQLRGTNFVKREVTARWHSFSEQYSFLNELNKDNLDLMHFTYFSHPVLYKRPFIATIHDVILLQHKTGKASTLSSVFYNLKHLAFRYAFMHQLKASKMIITPTETVKKQILSLYGNTYEKKIVALYEGIDFEKMSIKENAELAKKFTKKYLLYVGNFYPHKNVEKLIRAFSKIKEDVQLVLVGPRDYFLERTEELITSLHQEDRVIVCPDASDADLIYLYKHAEALVHPSLSEGFGLPVIEAQYFGTPVLTSNIPVFKEVLGNNHTMFNPKDEEDMRSKIEEFLQKKDPNSAKLNLNEFSFKTMTEKLLELYRFKLK